MYFNLGTKNEIEIYIENKNVKTKTNWIEYWLNSELNIALYCVVVKYYITKK